SGMARACAFTLPSPVGAEHSWASKVLAEVEEGQHGVPGAAFRIRTLGSIGEHGTRHVAMNPGYVSHEFAQEERSGDRASPAIPRVLEVRYVAFQLFGEVVEQRHAPKVLARLLRGLAKSLSELVVARV